MRIVSLSEEEFNKYAQKHKYESMFQNTSYAKFKCSSKHYDYKLIGFKDNNDNLIGATMLIFKTLFLGYKYAYAPRGFLIDYTNYNDVTRITNALKKLLHKQKFIFIKIDPPVIASERDFTGKSIYTSNTINMIIENLIKNDYRHLGFNLYNETLLSRWNVFAKLNKDAKLMYNSFSKEIKDNISISNKRGVKIIEDESLDIDKFYEFVKPRFGKMNKKFFINIINSYREKGSIKIFYSILDIDTFAKNINSLYDAELEKNEFLTSAIQSGDNIKYNIPKVINDRIESDKILEIYKKDIVNSSKLINKYPDGILCNACIVVSHGRGITIPFNYANVNFPQYNANGLMIYEILKYYSKSCIYANLGATTGNFNVNKKYYMAFNDKMGFNSSVIEYVGEFDLIINPLMYKIYLRKSKKKKLI